MFWKAVNGYDPTDCSEPIDLSGLTSDNNTHGTHAYHITSCVGDFENRKHDIVIGTVLDDGISWRMADSDETIMILEYYRSPEYESSQPD